ncbi:Calcium-transporting ATPase 1 [archaeon HR01]|nr:Calcium-transporting ATPase 1 [archaeon HR01]
MVQENTVNQTPWHSLSIDDVLARLKTDGERGLSSIEAGKRLERYGPNILQPIPRPSAFKIFVKQFANIMVGLLIAALVISGLLGELIDAIVIGVIVFFVAVIGFVQEYRAEKTLETLKKMLSPTTVVVRDGVEKEIAVKDLVPGDIVILYTGSKIPADLRLIETVNLQVNEATLTGESTPVSKIVEPLPERTPIHDRFNMAYAGTVVTYGRGKGVVVATGSRTEFGKIAGEASAVSEERTPLEVRMDEVGKRFALIAGVVIAVIFLVELTTELWSGVLSLSFLVEVLLFAVALAVAVVPEALPGIVTATLAIGMGIMARRNALVRRMPAVETLGSTQVICFDKTGTLTLNQMAVREVCLYGRHYKVSELKSSNDAGLQTLLNAVTLCNDASISRESGGPIVRGDPTEGALLLLAEELGVDVENVKRIFRRVYEIPFTSERKLMSTVHQGPQGTLTVYSKGAVEKVLAICSAIFESGQIRPINDEDSRNIMREAEVMAGKALRVLAVAYKEVDEVKPEMVEKELIFLGLVGMMDPPRPEALNAVKTAREAGMKPVMVTGDHKLTAIAVAREVGIYREGDLILTGEELDRMSDEELDRVVEDVTVYARISPMHKLRIVEAWQRSGYVVAMTGDGVNDAPALKRADIGIATGITGTDVSKEASDMILADDNFATIVKAVELGRWIYENVRKYLAYLLEANLVEIAVISSVALVIARVLGLQGEEALPLLPVHILYINLATDGLPAIALGFSPPDPDIMKRKPIPRHEPIFSREVRNFLYTVLLVATPIYLLGYITALEHGVEDARSRLFFMFIANELLLAINCRSLTHTIFKAKPHKWLVLAIVWEIALISTIMALPGGAETLRLQPPNTEDLAWILGGGITLSTSIELMKAIAHGRGLKSKDKYVVSEALTV